MRNRFKTISKFSPGVGWSVLGMALAATAGCNGTTALNPPGATVDASTPPPDLLGYRQMDVSIGPINLAPGEERTICTVFRLPAAAPMEIVRIDSKLLPGSHHLIFYKSNLTDEQLTPVDCQPLDIGFGQAMPKNIPLYISETQDQNALPLPSGVAYHFDAGQMVKLEAHYINSTQSMLIGKGTVSLTVGPSTQTYVPADIMFCGSVFELYSKGVPPGMSTLNPGFYKPPVGVSVFGLTAHQHQRGTEMTLAKSTGAADPGSMLVDGKPWDNEPFVTYDDRHLLTFGPNEGLRWQCSYNNPDQKTIKFGESAKDNEMCFLWAYYYPSVGHFISQECIR